MQSEGRSGGTSKAPRRGTRQNTSAASSSRSSSAKRGGPHIFEANGGGGGTSWHRNYTSNSSSTHSHTHNINPTCGRDGEVVAREDKNAHIVKIERNHINSLGINFNAVPGGPASAASASSTSSLSGLGRPPPSSTAGPDLLPREVPSRDTARIGTDRIFALGSNKNAVLGRPGSAARPAVQAATSSSSSAFARPTPISSPARSGSERPTTLKFGNNAVGSSCNAGAVSGLTAGAPSASSGALSRPAPSPSSSSGPNPLVLHASSKVAQIAPREMVKELVRRFKITEEEAARQWLAQRVPGERGDNVAEKQYTRTRLALQAQQMAAANLQEGSTTQGWVWMPALEAKAAPNAGGSARGRSRSRPRQPGKRSPDPTYRGRSRSRARDEPPTVQEAARSGGRCRACSLSRAPRGRAAEEGQVSRGESSTVRRPGEQEGDRPGDGGAWQAAAAAKAPRGSSKDDRAPPSPGRSLAEAPRGDLRPGEGGARQAAAAAKRVAEEGEKLRKREAEAAARKQQREEAALKRKEEAAAKRAKVEEDKQLRARMAAAEQSEARNVKRLQGAQECAAGKAAEAEKSRLLAMEKAASEKKRLAEEEKRQQRRAALDTWWGAIPTKPSPELSAAFVRFFREESS